MKTKLGVLLALILSSIGTAYATTADWNGVTVSFLWVSTNEGSPANVALVGFSATGNGASCGSANNKWGAIDLSTIGGQKLYSLLSVAKYAGTSVTVLGLGSCAVATGYETITVGQTEN